MGASKSSVPGCREARSPLRPSTGHVNANMLNKFAEQHVRVLLLAISAGASYEGALRKRTPNAWAPLPRPDFHVRNQGEIELGPIIPHYADSDAMLRLTDWSAQP